MKKLFSILLVILILQQLCKAQQNYWYLAPNKLNMSLAQPGSVPTTANTYTSSNALFDSNNNVVFSVVNGSVYDDSNNLVANLPNGFDNTFGNIGNIGGTEVNIVPVPGSTMSYYIIYEGAALGNGGDVLPMYIKVNVQNNNCISLQYNAGMGTVIDYDPAGQYLNGKKHIGIAVSKSINVNGDRFLYLVTAKGVNKCNITANGISTATQIVFFDDTPNPNVMFMLAKPDKPVIEADLATNGRFLAWSTNWGSLGLPEGAVGKVELDPITGNYINGSGITYTMSNPTGIEFRQISKGNSMLYIVNGVDLYKTNASLNQAPIAIGYNCAANSHLEMAKNGKMYGLMLHQPGQSTQTNFFTISSNDVISNELPFDIDSRYLAGFHQVEVFTLPEQIDGDNFSMTPFVITMGASINSTPLVANTLCNTTINFNYNTPLLLTSNFNPLTYVPNQYRIKIDRLDPSDGCGLVENIITSNWANYTGYPINLSSLICNNNHSFNLLTGFFKITYEVKNSCDDVNSFSSSFNVLQPANSEVSTGVITTNIGLHQRYEFGLTVPAVYNTKIETYLDNYTTMPAAMPSATINPYDPDKIKIKATFIDPIGNSYIRYGFYYKDVIAETYTGQYPNSSFKPHLTSLYKINYANYPFRVRLAPDMVGKWFVNVELLINNSATPIASNSFYFSVIPSNKRGPLSLYKDPVTGSKRYLKDFNGNDFFVVGQNIAPFNDEFSNNQPTQDGLFNNMCNQSNPNKAYTSTSPVIEDVMRSKILDLKSNGGNFIRTRMDPTTKSIEWGWEPGEVEMQLSNSQYVSTAKPLIKCLNDYDHKQNQSWELDKTLATCEQNNIYMMLNLFNDFDFANINMSWPDPNFFNGFWHKNPYSSVIETYPKGGSDFSMSDYTQSSFGLGIGVNQFFQENNTNMTPSSNANYAFKNIKKKLFYIMARYGYSPNIAVWQILNETDNTFDQIVDPNEDPPKRNSKYRIDPIFRTNVTRWVLDVNNELKSYYPKKLVLNGFGSSGKFDEIIIDKSFGSQQPQIISQPGQQAYHNNYNGDNNNGTDFIDIASYNYYYGNVGDNANGNPNFPIKLHNLSANPNLFRNYSGCNPALNQPFLGCEIGANPEIEALDGGTMNHIELWASCFAGQLGTYLPYWSQLNEANNFYNFKGISSFFNSININANEWYSNTSFNGISYNPNIHNYYMTNDGNKNSHLAIGWCQNYSYNWRSRQLRGDFNSINPLQSDMHCNVLNTFYPSSSALNYTTFPTANIDISTYVSWYFHSEGCLAQNNKPVGPYNINVNPLTEVAIKVENMTPNSIYNISFYDAYEGGYLSGEDQTVSSNSNGEVFFYKKLYGNVNIQTKQYPDYAYKLTKLSAREANTDNGLNEKQLEKIENSLSVYPNPNTGKFMIKLTGLYADDVYELKVLDVIGRVVKYENNIVGDINKEISLDKNERGMYLVYITSKKGVKLTKKIIVE